MTKEALIKALGREVRVRRKQKKLTQVGLALRADVHPNTISLIERAETVVGIDALFDIAAALNVTLSTLIKCAEERLGSR